MQIKLVIDFQLSQRARRAIVFVALPVAVFFGTAATVAIAGGVMPMGGIQPATIDAGWIQSGQPVSASDLAADLSGLQAQISAQQPLAPTAHTYVSGSGVYHTPTSPLPLYLRVRMAGGGGGGAGAGTSPGAGQNGGTTTFGTAFLSAGGGSGTTNLAGAGGGSADCPDAGELILLCMAGGNGGSETNSGTVDEPGGAGGTNPFGGSGGVPANNNSAGPAVDNTGAGGSGAGCNGNGGCGGGGGAGAYIEALIVSPALTYNYTVGGGGPGGTAGTNLQTGTGATGGNGAAGMIVIEEHYQ